MKLGEPAVFVCEAIGNPKPHILRWFFGPGKGRWGPTPRILHVFWALGEGGGAQNLVFYHSSGHFVDSMRFVQKKGACS